MIEGSFYDATIDTNFEGLMLHMNNISKEHKFAVIETTEGRKGVNMSQIEMIIQLNEKN